MGKNGEQQQAKNIRKEIYDFLSDQHSSKWAHLWSNLIFFLDTASAILFIIHTDPNIYTKKGESQPWLGFEYASAYLFGSLYLVRFFTSPDKPQFFFGFFNLVDITSVIAMFSEIYYVNDNIWISHLRIMRLLREIPHMPFDKASLIYEIVGSSFLKSIKILAAYAISIFAVVNIFSAIIFHIERGTWNEEESHWKEDGNISHFQSIADSYYWCIITITTVGYGDLHPRTFFGKTVASIMIICGIMMTGFPLYAVGYNYSKEIKRRFRFCNEHKKADQNMDGSSDATSSEKIHLLGGSITLKDKIRVLFHETSSSHLAEVFYLARIVANIALLIFFFVETLPEYYTDNPTMPWYAYEILFMVIFTTEYFVGLYTAPDYRNYIFDFFNVIDLFSLLPFYLEIICGTNIGDYAVFRNMRVLWVFRIFRIFSLNTFNKNFQIIWRTLKKSFEALLISLAILFFSLMLFSSWMYYAERGEYKKGVFCTSYVDDICVKTQFKGIISTVWWTIITMSTVGYGDYVPKTNNGKVVAGFVAISGMLVISFSMIILSNAFESEWVQSLKSEKTPSQVYDVMEQNRVRSHLSLKHKIFYSMEEPFFSEWGLYFNIAYMVTTIASVSLFCYSSTFDDDEPEPLWVYVLEFIFTIFFTTEIMVRYYCAPNFLEYFFSSAAIINLIATLPFYIDLVSSEDIHGLSALRILRLFHVLYFMKRTSIGRNLNALESTIRKGVDIFFLLACILCSEIIVFSSLLYYIERGEYVRGEWISEGERSMFQSIPGACWWGIVTFSSVGYGDMFPKKTLGKVLASIGILVAVLTVSLPVQLLSNTFASEWKKLKQPHPRLSDVLKDYKINWLKDDNGYTEIKDYEHQPNGMGSGNHPSFCHPAILNEDCSKIFTHISIKDMLVRIFESPAHPLEKLLSGLLEISAVVSVVLAIVSTNPRFQGDDDSGQFTASQGVLITIALIELAARFWVSPSCLVFSSIVNVVEAMSCIVYFIDLGVDENIQGLIALRSIRLIRIFTIFPDSHFTQAFVCLIETLWNSLDVMFVFSFVLMIEVIALSSIMWYLERGDWSGGEWRNDDGTRSRFQSIPDAFWWGIETLTTVGYGDMTPKSTMGKFVAGVSMATALPIMTMPFAAIYASFIENYSTITTPPPELDEEENARASKDSGYGQIDIHP